MAPYVWALVVLSTLHWCNPGPVLHRVDHSWPLSWFMSPQWVKEDPDEPEVGELWCVTVPFHEDVIEHFDTRDACVIYQATAFHDMSLCKTVEPPT